MARLPRFILAGHAHHLALRGHNGQAIWQTVEDAAHWVGRLREAAIVHRVVVHAWALLDDRFHVLATPQEAGGLSRFMQDIARRQAQHMNRRLGRSGTLWDGRFQASLVQPGPNLLQVQLYVEGLSLALAPNFLAEGGGANGSGREGSVPWSSVAHHIGLRADPLISSTAAYWALGNTPFDREARYRRLLLQGLGSDVCAHFEAMLRRGRPVGESAFVAALPGAEASGLQPRPRGRPRRQPLPTASP